MVLGCLDEMMGYVGRMILNGNPFSFAGFLMQIGERLSLKTAEKNRLRTIWLTVR